MENTFRHFATTVALITTRGRKYGQNVMAAEWTMQVSHRPMMIAVFVQDSPTCRNMLEARAFGVNIASDDQAELVNLAGGYSAKELNKLSIPGKFHTYRGPALRLPMIRGCALNAECRVTKVLKTGDHIMVLGKVVGARFDDAKLPLIYTRGNYRRISTRKIPSGRTVVRLAKTKLALFDELRAGRFVLKAVACIATNQGRTLLQKLDKSWTVPFVVVEKGENYPRAIERHLHALGASASAGRISTVSRTVLTDGTNSVRANFVAYRCTVSLRLTGERLRWFDRLPPGVLLRRQLLQDA